jgi:hypothetical protein
MANSYISFCERTIDNKPSSEMIKVSSLSINNSTTDEYCPTILRGGELVFTSNQQSNTLLNSEKIEGGADLFVSKSYCPTCIGTVSPFPTWKSSIYHQGAATFSSDGRTMYYTANVIEKVKAFSSVEPQNSLGIYVSSYNGDEWLKPELIFSKSGYNFAFPTVSETGDTMIFSSDIQNGQGGMDLYMSLNNGSDWGTPVNLGTTINTSGNEVYASLGQKNKKGNLYFSSDGRAGYGGLDIFSSVFVDGEGDSISALPRPINSNLDDFGYASASSELFGFFSSNRAGSDDIFLFEKEAQARTQGVNHETVDHTVMQPIIVEHPADIVVIGDDKNVEIVVESKPKLAERKVEIVQPQFEEKKEEPIENPEEEVKPSSKILHDAETQAKNSHAPGYYIIVYSAVNLENLTKYKNEHFPDALILNNSNGFYNLGYFLSTEKEIANTEFKKRRGNNSKAWLRHL